MFCIAAFVILAVLAVFSAKYRRALAKSWQCTSRRLTLRPCDTGFRDDAKARLLAPLAIRYPALVLPAGIALDVLSWLLILTTVWSLYTATKASANLVAYGTCAPSNAASCSLGAEACSIDSGEPEFWDSIVAGDLVGAVTRELAGFGAAFAAIPARLRDWRAEDFIPADATFHSTADASLPVAIEIIDPGCSVCRQLFRNMLESGFLDTHAVTYIAYPIPSPDGGTKFPNSTLVASVLQAIRMTPALAAQSADWGILERIFTGEVDGVPAQEVINEASGARTAEILRGWLAELGADDAQIDAVLRLAASPAVAAALEANAVVVRDEIDTVKIPTLITDGRRYDGLVSVDALR